MGIDGEKGMRNGTRIGLSVAAVGCILLVLPVPVSAGAYPSWWTNRNVIDSTVSDTNDFAAANQGQVKCIASNAYDEFEANLPGGAGTDVANLVGSFSSVSNYLAVNHGQLKNVAEPFYDRLKEEGYTNAYPWTGTTTDDVSFAAANIGQVKHLFGFDITYDSDSDSLSDWWENHYFGGITNQVGSDDSDGDALNNIGEYQNDTCPTNADTDADSMPDGWEVDNGLNPLSDDSGSDADSDGLSNAEEYDLDTDPQDNSDGQALLKHARHKIVNHWYMVKDSDITFTNAPGSEADLNDLKDALNSLSDEFYEVIQ